MLPGGNIVSAWLGVQVAESGRLTAADIARLAEVSRATVSNWRRRYPDFPGPTGGTETSPTFDLIEVEAWLAARGRLPERSPGQRLWHRIRELAGGPDVTVPVLRAAVFLLYLHRSGKRDVPPAPDDLSARLLAMNPDIPGIADLAAGLGPDELGLFGELVAQARDEEPLAIYESVLGRYLDIAGGRNAVTPGPLTALMLELADPDGATVLDPACGTGSLLATALQWGAVAVAGRERAGDLAVLAAVRVALTADTDIRQVRAGDALRHDDLAGFQAGAVVCNPPFGDRQWGHEELAYDQRWEYGLPPRSESELAWVQHGLARLSDGGRAVYLMPPAASSRSSGRRIRSELLRRGALRAVFALPLGAAPPHHVGLHLWVLERPVPDTSAKHSVLLVDTESGTDLYPGTGRVIDWPELRKIFAECWRDFLAGQDGTPPHPGARVMPVIDLLDEVVDVTPARHIRPDEADADPERVMADLAAVRSHLDAVLTDLPRRVPGVDWTPGGGPGWRVTTIGDLVKAGSIHLHRASPAAPRPDDEDDGQADGLPVLTLTDVIRHRPTSGTLGGTVPEPGQLQIEAGDVIIPAIVTPRFDVRVASAADEGAVVGRDLHLLRPVPGRIDPWFLAGFLAAPANVRRASYGSSVIRIDVRRLRIPLMPEDAQREYAMAFRQLEEFQSAARHAVALGRQVGERLRTALTNGTLRPDLDRSDQPKGTGS